MIRRAMGTAALILFGVICAGVVAEVGVRVANHFFPYFYCYDAARGWGLRPHTAGYYRREGAAYVEINSAGFRGPEFAIPKPPGTVRIAVIGDSYTEAIQVPYEDTFASVAARRLAQCPLLKGRRVEALNFGVDGYGTTQELVTLRDKVWAYQPDIVVLAIFLGNDVRNNSVSLEPNLCRPFYVERDGKLVPAGPFESSNSFRLWCMARFDYRKSGLFSLIGGAWTILTSRNQQPTAELPVERAISYDIYKPPTQQVWRDAWQVTDDMLAEIHRETARHGAAFLTVTLDTSIQVWPDASVRDNFMKHIGVSDLLYPDRRVAALGKRDGFDVLMLAEPLYQYAAAHHAFLHGFTNSKIGFGHWNVEGHRVAGELIGERLCAMAEAGKCPSCAAGGGRSPRSRAFCTPRADRRPRIETRRSHNGARSERRDSSPVQTGRLGSRVVAGRVDPRKPSPRKEIFTMRGTKLLARGLGALAIGAICAGAAAAGTPATPIEHVVVIFQENVSLNHYFASYPHAANPPGVPQFFARPRTPTVNGLTGALLTNNPNKNNPTNVPQVNPFLLDRSQASICDQDHNYGDEQLAFDEALMDLFPASVGVG